MSTRLGTALLLALVWGRAAHAQGGDAPPPADANLVAVLPLDVVGNVPAGKPALEAAVMRGLTMYAGPTLEATQASARLTAAGAKMPCEEASCWSAAGKAVGARHLIFGRVERKGPNFEVQFRLFEGASGRLLATETNRCEAADCSVAELARQTVRELARQVLIDAAPGGPAATAPPAIAPEPGTGASTGSAGVPTAPGASPPVGVQQDAAPARSTRRWLVPTAVITAGVATSVVGGWMISRNNDCAGDRLTLGGCNELHDTMLEGVGLTGAGVALAATGVVLAITGWGLESEPPPVAIGPGGVVFSGRF